LSQTFEILGTPDRSYDSHHLPFKPTLFPFTIRLICDYIGKFPVDRAGPFGRTPGPEYVEWFSRSIEDRKKGRVT
jgi:hypothetical protein